MHDCESQVSYSDTHPFTPLANRRSQESPGIKTVSIFQWLQHSIELHVSVCNPHTHTHTHTHTHAHTHIQFGNGEREEKERYV